MLVLGRFQSFSEREQLAVFLINHHAALWPDEVSICFLSASPPAVLRAAGVQVQGQDVGQARGLEDLRVLLGELFGQTGSDVSTEPL